MNTLLVSWYQWTMLSSYHPRGISVNQCNPMISCYPIIQEVYQWYQDINTPSGISVKHVSLIIPRVYHVISQYQGVSLFPITQRDISVNHVISVNEHLPHPSRGISVNQCNSMISLSTKGISVNQCITQGVYQAIKIPWYQWTLSRDIFPY